MSVTFPYLNSQFSGAGALRYDMPSTAAPKVANTAIVLGCWIRPTDRAFSATRPYKFLVSQNGNTGGNDAYIGFTNASLDNMICWIKRGTPIVFNQTLALGGAAYGKTLLVMLIADATASHLVVCEPGGTPLVVTQADNQLYTAAWSTTPFMHRLGSGPNHAWWGDMEDYFYLYGGFPMVSGAPDPTLVQAIANGTQSLDTLDTLLTGGVKKCRYRMKTAFDFADAWALNADLTPVNVNAPVGLMVRSGGPLRPVALRPARTRSMVSQVTFGQRGVAASATAKIRTEGGVYVGITPAAIQARLLKEDGTVHVNWTTVDAAPAGGTWAAGQIVGVPMVAGFLTLEFRAVDGLGAQIGETVSSHGQRGAGFSYLSCAQSQLMHLWGTAPLALPSGIRVLCTRQYGTAAPLGQTEQGIIGSGSPNQDILGWGMRQAAIEINTLFPGVPIHFMTVGDSGDPQDNFAPGGLYADRWANLAAHIGLIQPHRLLLYGHSNVPSADDVAYAAKLNEVVTLYETYFGPQSLGVIICPTPRYSGVTGGSFGYPDIARKGGRLWAAGNPAKAFWAGSFHGVETTESTTTPDPHPAQTANGHGRSGAHQAWAVLRASGAVADQTIGIVSAKATGTQVKVQFGPVS